MQLTSERRAGALVVQVMEPRLDAAVAVAFKEAMHAVTAGAEPRVVLDLSTVTFLDSSGLGAVVSVMKHLGAGRRLELAGLTPPVAKVFRLTRMDSVFVIHPAVPGSGGAPSGATVTPLSEAQDHSPRSGGTDPGADRPARLHAG